jgi:hypothetical protein
LKNKNLPGVGGSLLLLPSYSGSRDQEDHSLKPFRANRPYLEKKKSQKRAGEVAQGAGLEFNPHTTKKKKNPFLGLCLKK